MFTLSKYTSLAKYAIAKTKNPSLMNDENIGYVASFAMLRDRQYNPKRCSSRLKFTRIMMNYAVSKIIDRAKMDSRYVSNMDSYLESRRNDNDNPYNIIANKEIIEILKEKLPEKYFNVLEQYYLENKTLQEIGDDIGCTRENVRQQLNYALNMARSLVE